MSQKVLIEVVIDSVRSAIAAQEGGANRVELCDNLVEGGTTPSAGMIQQVRTSINIGLQVMIRPRGGDFCYAPEELAVMKQDIQMVKALGADGVVFGLLTEAAHIDVANMQELIDLARPMNVTCHRAFDMTVDPEKALQELIELGVDQLLTSGTQTTAVEGKTQIAQWVQAVGDKIEIMPGSGITAENVQEILETGVQSIHTSGRGSIDSKMQFRNPHISMGGGRLPAEYELLVADTQKIAAVRKKVDEGR